MNDSKRFLLLSAAVVVLGIVLGIMDDFPYAEETVRFGAGDLFVVFSDGISEAVNGRDEQFGEERIEEVLRRHRHGTAGEISDRLIAAVRTHADGAPQADDITLVVIKRE